MFVCVDVICFKVLVVVFVRSHRKTIILFQFVIFLHFDVGSAGVLKLTYVVCCVVFVIIDIYIVCVVCLSFEHSTCSNCELVTLNVLNDEIKLL